MRVHLTGPVVRSGKQASVIRERIEAFKDALADLRNATKGLDPRLGRAVANGYRIRIEELAGQLKAYEALRGGEVDALVLDDLGSLGDALVASRIAKGWSQAELAEAVDVKPQQIQRYEACRYESASLERIRAIAEALAVGFRTTVLLHESMQAEPPRPSAFPGQGERIPVGSTTERRGVRTGDLGQLLEELSDPERSLLAGVLAGRSPKDVSQELGLDPAVAAGLLRRSVPALMRRLRAVGSQWDEEPAERVEGGHRGGR